MAHTDWKTYEKAYEELRKRGVSHDAASERALYLARRGALPARTNWSMIAKQCRINEAKRADNRLSTSLDTIADHDASGKPITLDEVLPAKPTDSTPEDIAAARIELESVPDEIRRLFTERDRELTNTDYSRLHRFRKRKR